MSVGILAGGQSRRMGQDKAFLRVGGQAVIQRVLEQVQPISNDVIVVTNTPNRYRDELPEFFGPAALAQPRLVPDVFPGKGSLGGIYTALLAAKDQHCLIVACDMPFLAPRLLRQLLDLAPAYDVVIPQVNDYLETTHAVYGKACLKPIARRLEANQFKIRGFFDEVKVCIVDSQQIAKIDPEYRSFVNMNTPDDWRQVQRMASKKK